MEFPASLRTVAQEAFACCKNLASVKFNDGLEVLGTDEYWDKGRRLYGVFEKSSLVSVKLPSTLKKIESWAFGRCENLESIQLPDGLETIRVGCFFETSLKEITLPLSAKEIGIEAFCHCT